MPMAVLVDNTQDSRAHVSEIRRALTSFVKAVDGLGPVAIIGVADRPTILRDYTTNPAQLADGTELASEYSYWFLLREHEPQLCLRTDGWVGDRAGSWHDLQLQYGISRRIWPLIMSVAGSLLP